MFWHLGKHKNESFPPPSRVNVRSDGDRKSDPLGALLIGFTLQRYLVGLNLKRFPEFAVGI